MNNIHADRLFFYILLLLITIITLILIWPYIGAVVLAVTVAIVLQPAQRWFLRRTGGRAGPATALTLLFTLLLVVIPTLIGFGLVLDALLALSGDVSAAMRGQQVVWLTYIRDVDRWLSSTVLAATLQLEPGAFTLTVRELVNEAGAWLLRWLAVTSLSVFDLILPAVVFISLLGTLLTNNERAVRLMKNLSPLDDEIDQIFLDRSRIMTNAMMRSIVVVAVVQGVVTGLLMALVGTPHIVPLTLAGVILSILPGGAAIVAIPVGLGHLLVGNTWAGIVVILGTVTLVAGLANQVRPRLVSKDAYLNRAFVLLSVFSGFALFGYMGVVYGPLIMILFTTVLEVYLTYYRPGSASVTPPPSKDPNTDV